MVYIELTNLGTKKIFNLIGIITLNPRGFALVGNNFKEFNLSLVVPSTFHFVVDFVQLDNFVTFILLKCAI